MPAPPSSPSCQSRRADHCFYPTDYSVCCFTAGKLKEILLFIMLSYKPVVNWCRTPLHVDAPGTQQERGLGVLGGQGTAQLEGLQPGMEV